MAGQGGGVTLGFLKFVLGLDGLAFEEGLNLSSKQLKAAQKKFDATGKQIAGIGQKMALGITAPFAALVASAIPAANESAAALAQVNAALTSMGPVAGKTTADLQKAAEELQHISTFDDDDILKSVTANMLTFGNITGTVFDRAQLAVVNLSARMGTDLQSATVMIGKALNDPAKGLAALARAGIQFTEAQKAQIIAMQASGNAAGAQSIMLAELEGQFGGAAAAARGASPTADMNEKWRTFQETVGAIVLKVLPPLTDLLTRILNGFNQLSPGMQTTVIAGVALTAALGPLLIGLGAIVSSVGTLLPLILGTPAAFATFAGIITTTVIPTLTALGIASLPLLPWLAAIAGAVALVYATWKHWPEIVAYVKAVYTGVKTWLIDKLDGVWSLITGKIEMVKKAFYNLYDAVVGHSYIPDMVDGIGASMARLDQLLVGKAKDVTDKTKAIFAAMADETQGIFERFASAGSTPLTKGQQAAPDGLVDFARIDQEIADFSASLSTNLAEPARNATIDTANAFANMAQDIGDSISRVSSAIKGGDFLDILGSIVDTVAQFVGNTSALFSGGSSGSGSVGFGGARAMGGPTVPGKTYLIGENGPEFFTPGARGFVTPNNDNGGGRGGMIQVLPSPYFNVVVDGRAQAVAQPLVGAGMVQASQGAQVAMMRRGSRRLA